jgi:predicted nucleic acid-binding protein
VVARIVLKQPGAIPDWGAWDEAASSRLLAVEARRAIDRLLINLRLTPGEAASALQRLRLVERGLTFVDIDERVIDAASRPLPAVLGTLDAIHLATAELYQAEVGAPLIFATHDRQLALAATLLGFEVAGV